MYTVIVGITPMKPKGSMISWPSHKEGRSNQRGKLYGLRANQTLYLAPLTCLTFSFRVLFYRGNRFGPMTAERIVVLLVLTVLSVLRTPYDCQIWPFKDILLALSLSDPNEDPDFPFFDLFSFIYFWISNSFWFPSSLSLGFSRLHFGSSLQGARVMSVNMIIHIPHEDARY